MEDVENLSSFGRNVGIAFQLIDDLIGIIGDPKVTGKAVGNDIREGKNTYPILLALNHARGEKKNKILKVFRSKNASSTDLEEAVRTISAIGIDQHVRNAAKSTYRQSNKINRRIMKFRCQESPRIFCQIYSGKEHCNT